MTLKLILSDLILILLQLIPLRLILLELRALRETIPIGCKPAD
jgi:hypothetical protein